MLAAAAGVWLGHLALDDLVERQGAPLQRAPWVGLCVVLVSGLWMTYRRLRPASRAAGALVVGVAAISNGAVHIVNLSRQSKIAVEWTGVACALAGAAALALAGLTLFRGRRTRTSGSWSRWRGRAMGVVLFTAVLPTVVVPLAIATAQTHRAYRPPGETGPSGFTAVEFQSADGLTLSGWYHPTTNGAAVLVVSSARGSRDGGIRHARLLAGRGYGVLAYDARGSGLSGGLPNGYGWGWKRDIEGALDFLTAQPGVDPDRVGAIGVSTGADALLEAAVDQRIAAVVADGATASSSADLEGVGPMETIQLVSVFIWVSAMSGSTAPPARDRLVSRVRCPLMLIAAGSIPQEIPLNRRYAAAHGSAELWELPAVHHTEAVEEVPDAFARHVVGFFNDHLH